jgi:hypothetical protein
MARPTVYNHKLGVRICDLIAEGSSLRLIGEMSAMPSRRSMRGWLIKHPEFAEAYELARRERTDNLVDETIEIADSVRGSDSNPAVQAAKLAVDTRRWLAAKLLPERFGERSAVELSGKDGKDLIPPAPEPPWKVALALLSILRNTEPQDRASEAAEPPEPGTADRASPAPPRLGTMDAEPLEPVADLEEQRRQLRADRERGILSKYPRR